MKKRKFDDGDELELDLNERQATVKARTHSKGGIRRVAKWLLVILLTAVLIGPPALWFTLLGYWHHRDAEYKQLVSANLPYATPVVIPGIVSAQEGKDQPRQLSNSLAWDRKEWVDMEHANTPENHLYQAIIAIEDPAFYTRKYSPDFWGKGRAVAGCVGYTLKNFRPGCRGGGSDITEQMVKGVMWPKPGRDGWRKVNETGLARVVESQWTKDQIITRYVNEAYLGDGQTLVGKGFQSASQGYLGKDLNQLELHESALLAAMLPNPNRFSPVLHPQDAKERRDLVLTRMAEQGFIKPAEAEAAKKMPVVVHLRNINAGLAPHFGGKVLGSLSAVTGDAVSSKDAAALRVETTLDANGQQVLYPVFAKAVADLRAQLAKKKVKNASSLEAAFVWVNRQGEIKEYFGSADYTRNQNDHVGVTQRQIGSTFKPIQYGLLEEQGKGDVLWLDSQAEGGHPKNFKDEYLNYEISWQEALWRSKNVIATRVAQEVGVRAMAERAEQAGLPKPNADLAAALGTKEATMLQVASMYLMFANGGQWTPIKPIAAVKRLDGTDVPVKYEDPRTVFSLEVTAKVVDALRHVVSDPTGTAFGISKKVPQLDIFGKTGTTQTPDGKEKDAWFVACTPDGCGVVWVGFDDNRAIAATGGSAAAPIWAAVVSKLYAVKGYKGELPFGVINPILTGVIQVEPTADAQASPTPVVSPTPWISEERANEIIEGQLGGKLEKGTAVEQTPCANWKDCLKQSKQPAQGEAEPTPIPQAPKPAPTVQPVAKPAATPDCATNWRGCVQPKKPE